MDDENIIKGAKNCKIFASTVYPIVSAYEFEFLKEEDVFLERLEKSSIYLMVQRPLTYFDQVTLSEFDNCIKFQISDGNSKPLNCSISLVENGICLEGETVEIEIGFHGANASKTQPLRDVMGFRIRKLNGEFILWWSPYKFLYEVLVNGLKAEIEGDPFKFLDFKVLYIGQAFAQKIWKRLTGHEKMQKILTVENPIGASPFSRAPFEVSLILLDMVGFDELVEVPYSGLFSAEEDEPILHEIDLNDEDALGNFGYKTFVPLRDEAFTREVEALLIKNFRPEYNVKMFDNYPKIAGGMRSKGYTKTDLVIERIPARLETEFFSIKPIL